MTATRGATGEWSADFGARLRSLREVAGLSQEKLAEKAGLTAKGIGALERGERRHPYPHTVRALADALGLLGVEREALFAAAPKREGMAFATPAAIAGPSSAVPVPLTPLIGREREADVLVDLLRRGVRLVTLTGPGGVGKTRLALEVVGEVAGEFSDGFVLVLLAPLGDPALVVATIARALGLREAGPQPLRDLLRSHLRSKRLLLVLDNFEHVLDAATEVGELLASCPGVCVLATSRAPLRLRSEREYPVGLLSVPELDRFTSVAELEGVPAVELFVERARAASPAFAFTRANVAAVTAICRRLDGLPLALELAAARVRSLTPAELLARLDRGLPLLSGGARDLPERQQTMRRAIEWSYQLLAESESRLFNRLSVFAGGWDLGAAEAVGIGDDLSGEDVLDPLSRLVEQSLAVAETNSEGQTRYRMLEPVRQYARERLEESGEGAAARRRHAAYYEAMALRAGQELTGPGQVVWMERLDREHDNLRAAMGTLLERGETGEVAGIGWGVWWFWFLRGFLTEGKQWMERVLASDITLPALPRARATVVAAGLAFARGDYEQAAASLDDGAEIARGADDQAVLATALLLHAFTAVNQGDYLRAAIWAEESARMHDALGDKSSAGLALLAAVHASVGRGDLARAEHLLDEGEALARASGAPFSIAGALNVRAMLAQMSGDYTGTVELLRESLTLSRALRDVYALGNGLISLASALVASGQAERAARLFGAAEALREATGTPIQYAGRRAVYERQVAALHEQLGADALGAAWAAGRKLRLVEAIDEALGR